MRILSQNGHGLVPLLADELCYRIVHHMHRRAARGASWTLPLCGSSGDLITHRLLSTGAFERVQFDALDVLIAERDDPTSIFHGKDRLFIDAGANIGLYAMRFARHFERVLAVEPNPVTQLLLQANLAIKRVSNVTGVACGLSDRDGEVDLVTDPGGSLGWAKVAAESSAESSDVDVVRVPVERLDGLVARLAPGETVSVLKIDVEGHEDAVLRGAAETLRRDAPVVLYEQLPGAPAAACSGLLKSFGYNRFSVFQRRFGLGSALSGSRVVEVHIDPDTISEAALICAART